MSEEWQRDINIAFKLVKAEAIAECLQIVEYYRDAGDGIFMAIQELNELKENCND